MAQIADQVDQLADGEAEECDGGELVHVWLPPPFREALDAAEPDLVTGSETPLVGALLTHASVRCLWHTPAPRSEGGGRRGSEIPLRRVGHAGPGQAELERLVQERGGLAERQAPAGDHRARRR